MRLFLVAAAFCAAAAPAAAQSRAELDAVQSLNNPLVQEGIASMVSAVADIVLDTRVGPLLRHADDGIRPGDTLRDLQRRSDPDFEAKLHDQTRRAVAGAGMVATDALAMRSELARTADRLRAALGPLAALASGYGRDDD